MRTVAIVGFGTMGSAVAQLFAQKGFLVRGHDIRDDALVKGLESIRRGRFGLNSMVKLGKMEAPEADSILARISVSTNLEETVSDADIVVENVDEDISLKKKIFKKLDEFCNEDVILASDTSSLSITAIASDTKFIQRVIGMHLFIPPQVMPLVEIISGLMTSKMTMDKLGEISRHLGKIVIVSKDRPGFVVARLGLRQFVEACLIAEQGIASVEDIDIGAKKGLGHPMGPFELTDLIGLDTRMAILQAMFEETGDPTWKPPALLRQLVESGFWGDPLLKQGSRGGFYKFFGIGEVGSDIGTKVKFKT